MRGKTKICPVCQISPMWPESSTCKQCFIKNEANHALEKNTRLTEKLCIRCNQIKSSTKFYKAGKYNRLRTDCIDCHKKSGTKRAKENKIVAPHIRKNTLLKYKYGITLLQYNDLLMQQNNMCAICRTTVPGGWKNVFVVDHCHKTGKVRGLLCINCNIGLGGFKDNKDSLLSAISYLGKLA